MGDLARCLDYGAFLRSKRQADDGRDLFMYDYNTPFLLTTIEQSIIKIFLRLQLHIQ